MLSSVSRAFLCFFLYNKLLISRSKLVIYERHTYTQIHEKPHFNFSKRVTGHNHGTSQVLDDSIQLIAAARGPFVAPVRVTRNLLFSRGVKDACPPLDLSDVSLGIQKTNLGQFDGFVSHSRMHLVIKHFKVFFRNVLRFLNG